MGRLRKTELSLEPRKVPGRGGGGKLRQEQSRHKWLRDQELLEAGGQSAVRLWHWFGCE